MPYTNVALQPRDNNTLHRSTACAPNQKSTIIVRCPGELGRYPAQKMFRRISLASFFALFIAICALIGFAINEWKASKITPTIVKSESHLRDLTSNSTSLLFIHDDWNKHYMIYDETFSRFATTWTGRRHKCLILDDFKSEFDRDEFEHFASKILKSANVDHTRFGIYSGINSGFLIWYKNGKPIHYNYVLDLLPGTQAQQLQKLSRETNRTFKNAG